MKKMHSILSIWLVIALILGLSAVPVSADATVTYNASTNIIYANGVSIQIKADTDGNTYVYNAAGTTKLIDAPANTAAAVYGGSESGTVASTEIVMTSGTVKAIYGGCRDGSVTGLSHVRLTGGSCSGSVICGGMNATTGSTLLEATNFTAKNMTGGGYKGGIGGNVDVLLTNCTISTTFYGGNSGTSGLGAITGNVHVAVSGGSILNFFGGSNTSGVVNGAIIIDFTNNPAITSPTNFVPSGKTGAALGTTVNITGAFDSLANMIKSGNLMVYQDGVLIYGSAVQLAGDKVYAGGVPVLVKLDADGKTYIWNSTGTSKLLPDAIDGKTLYGGNASTAAANASISMVSGSLAAIYGGGETGDITGQVLVSISGGTVGAVNSGCATGAMTGTAIILVDGPAAITALAPADGTVVNLPAGFDLAKVANQANIRLYVGGLMIPTGTVPDHVTRNGENYFANGIPVVVKMDADKNTYIYDAAGTAKLLADPVDGAAPVIYGGSETGAVASTSVTIESGCVFDVYGGGLYGCVTGTSRVVVNGGIISGSVYGGSRDGDVGSTDVAVNCNIAKSVNGGGYYGVVVGDTRVVLNNCITQGVYGGSRGALRTGYPDPDILGNTSITMTNGQATKIYGGCTAGQVRGQAAITIIGNTWVTTQVLPLGNAGVVGGCAVTVPANFQYDSTILTGAGISVSHTGAPAVYDVAEPVLASRRAEVISAAGDSGKLVFRFLSFPGPDTGEYVARTGDSYFITFPNGETMLVDAAIDESGPSLIALLQEMGVTRIDHLVASHFHEDHIGSMYQIIDNFTIGTLYLPDFRLADDSVACYHELMLRVNAADRAFAVVNLSRGDTLDIGGVHIDILNPPTDDAAYKAVLESSAITTEIHNNASLVMKFSYGGKSALLTGDIYAAAEAELLAAYAADPTLLNVDLVKTPHHGTTSSSSINFIKALSPDIAVLTHFVDTVSVNERYRAFGAATYVTGEDGIVKVSLDAAGNMIPLTEFYVESESSQPDPGNLPQTGEDWHLALLGVLLLAMAGSLLWLRIKRLN